MTYAADRFVSGECPTGEKAFVRLRIDCFQLLERSGNPALTRFWVVKIEEQN